ncbi:hypothetical protein B0H12DRAFT_1074909 [Mycena haematopus]|nr:hypothetical protein B0H12DRAFT_1074909 [Mycena haematopus]
MKELLAKDNLSIEVWVRAVNKIDDQRRRELDIHRRLIAETNKENRDAKRKANDDEDRNAKKHQNAKGTASKPPSTEGGAKNPYPPKLGEEERELLSANEGCMRCRKPFAGHRSFECTSPATADNYQVVTEKVIADARKAQKGKASSSGAGQSSKAVAAIMPPVQRERRQRHELGFGEPYAGS